jgi:hypothetical protein
MRLAGLRYLDARSLMASPDPSHHFWRFLSNLRRVHYVACLILFQILNFCTFSVISIFNCMYATLNIGKKTNYIVWL